MPDDRLFDVAGRVVVITGGLGQLGSRFARALIERGARVAVFDLLEDSALWQQRFEAQADHSSLRGYKVDITDRSSLQAALSAMRKDWDMPAGLVKSRVMPSLLRLCS